MILELQALVVPRRLRPNDSDWNTVQYVRHHLRERDRVTPRGTSPQYQETDHYRLHSGRLPAPFLAYTTADCLDVYWMAVSPQPEVGATFLVVVDVRRDAITADSIIALIESLQSLLPANVDFADIRIRVGHFIECRVEQYADRPVSVDLKAGLVLVLGLVPPLAGWSFLSEVFREVLLLGLLVNSLYGLLLALALWLLQKPRIQRRVVFYRGK